MNQTSDTKRLADAINGLASTILEIISERVQAAHSVQAAQTGVASQVERKAPILGEPLVTKKQAAAHFQVSLRTIHTWLEQGRLPYYRIGRNVRIKMSDAEARLNERYLMRGRSWSR